MRIEIIDHAVSPGGAGGGDDRYGFDEAAGTAWVIDGATDVTDVRLFPEAESDAAWYAEALSARLTTPPEPHDSAIGYLKAAITDVAHRAEETARADLSDLPRHMLPSAAGVWMRLRADGFLELLWLGDCIALVRPGRSGAVSVYGELDKIDAETREVHASADETKDVRRKRMQVGRDRMNTAAGYKILSVHPEALDHAGTARLPVAPGGRVLLVSDGLFRLVAPYGLRTAEGLFDGAETIGLGGLLDELRSYERDPARAGLASGRRKASDDATGLLIEIVAD
jgi:hypothetical protein